MIYQLILCFVCLLLDTLAAAGVATQEKDLEIALLRQQLRILERKANTKPHLSRPEKLILVALVKRLKVVSQSFHDRLGQCMLLVKPDTLLKWHRDLLRRKWTFHRHSVGGRPRIEAELEDLIVRLARENPRMGFDRIQGELLKLGYEVVRSTVRTVREECLDHLLILGEHHLLRVLQEYLTHYNTARPHQGLEQQAPIPFIPSLPPRPIRWRDVLVGLIHDYYREVAQPFSHSWMTLPSPTVDNTRYSLSRTDIKIASTRPGQSRLPHQGTVLCLQPNICQILRQRDVRAGPQ